MSDIHQNPLHSSLGWLERDRTVSDLGEKKNKNRAAVHFLKSFMASAWVGEPFLLIEGRKVMPDVLLRSNVRLGMLSFIVSFLINELSVLLVSIPH